jgi:hypothetical protein
MITKKDTQDERETWIRENADRQDEVILAAENRP